MVCLVYVAELEAASTDAGYSFDPTDLLGDEFDDEVLELRSAVDYLSQCGVSSKEIRKMPQHVILDEYHVFLQLEAI